MNESKPIKLIVFAETRPNEIIEPLKTSNIDFYKMVPQGENFIIRYIKYFLLGLYGIYIYDPDRILTNALGPLSFVAGVLGGLTGIPVTIRLGGDFWKVHYTKVQKGLNQWDVKIIFIYSIRILASKITCLISDSCLVVSENVRKSAIDNTSIAEENIIKIPVPVDTNKYSPDDPSNERLSIPETNYSNIIVTVTNLQYYDKMKAIVDMLPKISELIKNTDNTTYLIAGNGQYLSQLRKEIKSELSDTHDHIHTIGYVNRIPDLLRVSDVMIYVSYNDGSPNAVLEAQATALPVVANNCFGMSEQIVNGKTGFLIDNEEELYDVCIDLLESDELRYQIGSTARQRIIKRNSISKTGKCISRGIKTIHYKNA
jgi:glycosyltransferase involved in cell wall biosynthesis